MVRFAIVGDPHIAVPHTIGDPNKRVHLVEVSIPALEQVFDRLETLDIDFLLLPGDLTQHGEPDNHRWLSRRLEKLPFPVCVVPGNHDIPVLNADDRSIAAADFSSYYRNFGYDNSHTLYYTREIVPGIQIIGLNSNQFDANGKQLGRLDDEQLHWLETVLGELGDKFAIVLIHHNTIEHLPGQSQHSLGRRYMLDNAKTLLQLLRNAGVRLICTGHLHVQDIVCDRDIWEITSGSLVSYPHPYRILDLHRDRAGKVALSIETERVEAVETQPNLSHFSREWLAKKSPPFMRRLLTEPPVNLPADKAEQFIDDLRYFWADISRGDAQFSFPHFPPQVRQYFESFSAVEAIDNCVTLQLSVDRPYIADK